MAPTIEQRKRELQKWTKDRIVEEWRKAIGKQDELERKTVAELINDILKTEFPMPSSG